MAPDGAVHRFQPSTRSDGSSTRAARVRYGASIYRFCTRGWRPEPEAKVSAPAASVKRSSGELRADDLDPPRGPGPARHGADTPFSAAPEAQQTAWLLEVDETPFFAAVRRLTVLGLTAMPKYGGNHDGLGWKLIGFVDGHFWEPPFGYYDQNYPGFEPYPGTQPDTA